jgi:hypothetical protein
MAHNLDTDQHKRKRDIADDNSSQVHADRIPQPPPPQSGKSLFPSPIDYQTGLPVRTADDPQTSAALLLLYN